MKLPNLFGTLLIGSLVILTLLAPLGVVSAADTYAGYVMGYFKESPDGSQNTFALHLAYSSDGLNWTPLNQNNPVVTPTLGEKGLRDPFILRKQDGTFVVMATNMNGQDFSGNKSMYIHSISDG